MSRPVPLLGARSFIATAYMGAASEVFWQKGRMIALFPGKGGALWGFLAKSPKSGNIRSCSAATPCRDFSAWLGELSPGGPWLQTVPWEG